MDNMMMNNINVYRRISLNCYDSYLECEDKRKSCNSIAMGKDGVEFGFKLRIKMYEFAVQTIVFSALTVEAFCNDFLITYLGKKDFELLDKLEIKSKILIGTKMVTGKDYPKDKVAFERILKLISMRNKLVHAKSVPVDSESSKILFEIEKGDLKEGLSSFVLVVKEIDELSPELKVKEKYISSDERLRDWYYINS